MDMAGVVEAVGPDAGDKVKKGDAIMARMDPLKAPGSLMEYVVLENGDWVHANGIDKDQAAGAGTAALTAYQCLRPYVEEGDKVFINGGGGGVGLTGIQIAKILGCHVTVSCSEEKAEFCKELGADEVIDYKKLDVTEELLKRGQVMKVIMDNVGNSPANLYNRCDGILKEDGVYCYVGGRMSAKTMWNTGGSLLRPGWLGGQKRKFVMFMTKTVKEHLEEIAGWMKEGKLKMVIDEVFGFEEVDKAFAKLKTDKCRGKVIVRVSEE
jgi:NADPH:quinone reductase-like Zn-dependent oxidoreductase